ncbi:hypothetical protein TNCV_4171341 [Trichonephila clavipes]|nr:hypothetical protein TNCV_4171341 [Trichonephila clavipes]
MRRGFKDNFLSQQDREFQAKQSEIGFIHVGQWCVFRRQQYTVRPEESGMMNIEIGCKVSEYLEQMEKEEKSSLKENRKSSRKSISPGSPVPAVVTFIHKVLVLYTPEAAAMIGSDDK